MEKDIKYILEVQDKRISGFKSMAEAIKHYDKMPDFFKGKSDAIVETQNGYFSGRVYFR